MNRTEFNQLPDDLKRDVRDPLGHLGRAGL